MLDFTSALYLGLRHPSHALGPWAQLTTGVPAALGVTRQCQLAERQVAELIGQEDAVMAASTLHLAMDMFMIPAHRAMAIYVDSGRYPILQWGVERARAKGTPVHRFAHHDPDDLRQQVARGSKKGLRPLIVADGFCPSCGRSAPLRDYLVCAERHYGVVAIDDTQALGILGSSPSTSRPYGTGGGGSLRHFSIDGPSVITIYSLAKGFGVPVAVLGGSSRIVRKFKLESDTRVHCSPPSAAAIQAALRAVAVNKKCGDALRARLLWIVKRFRSRIRETGMRTIGGLFPVQTLTSSPPLDARTMHQSLLRHGVRTVLRRGSTGGRPRLSLILTAAHNPGEIDRVADVLFELYHGQTASRRAKEVQYETANRCDFRISR